MNVLITTARDGVLTVHKDTCKKIEDRETFEVDDLLQTNPGGLTTAKRASCCKPSEAIVEEVEQAGWDALEAAANSEAVADEPADEAEDLIGEEDLIGDVQQDDEGTTASDEDLIGVGITNAPAREAGDTATKVQGKATTRVAAARTESRELNGLEALKKVAGYLSINLGARPVFPGFGKAFKSAEKQSIYINSKGNADVRAKDAEQADEWGAFDHVERRSGNYVRVNLAAL